MLILVTGGAGSGKSAFAEKLCCRLPGERVYLATMQANDQESRERIAKHRRQRRGLGFQTLEHPWRLLEAKIKQGANILLEDLSNLLANELFGEQVGGEEAVREGLRHLAETGVHLTVVTNEIFSGGAKYGEETRQYMQSLARLNRELAAEADLAVEVISGIPNVLKGELPW